MKAKKKEIPERPIGALGADIGGPSWTILSMEPPPARGGGKILKDGDAKEIAERLATALRDEAKVL
jgi:electron transfer flavoprotein alpha/beta subunit